jgi:hypothetical protein
MGGSRGVFIRYVRGVGSEMDGLDLICEPCAPPLMCTRYVPKYEILLEYFFEKIGRGRAPTLIALNKSYLQCKRGARKQPTSEMKKNRRKETNTIQCT